MCVCLEDRMMTPIISLGICAPAESVQFTDSTKPNLRLHVGRYTYTCLNQMKSPEVCMPHGEK